MQLSFCRWCNSSTKIASLPYYPDRHYVLCTNEACRASGPLDDDGSKWNSLMGTNHQPKTTYYDPKKMPPYCKCGDLPYRSQENPAVFWCAGCCSFNGDLRGL